MNRVVTLMALIILVMATAGISLAGTWSRIDVSAQQVTAYALGSLYNGIGDVIGVGDVAMGPRNADACLDSDPNTVCAPVLPFGTRIYLTSSSISIPLDDGTPATYTSFLVNDMGDIFSPRRHADDPYWIDVYHGRWHESNGTCSCWGVYDDQATCYVGQTNSCDNAVAFGKRYNVAYYYMTDGPTPY